MCSNMQCVWQLATNSREQIYEIHDTISFSKNTDTFGGENDSSESVSSELKHVQNQNNTLTERGLEEKGINNDDEDHFPGMDDLSVSTLLVFS